MACLVEEFVSGDRAQALVPELDRKRCAGGQLACERLDLGGPGADRTGEVEGVADDEGGDLVTLSQAGEAAEVFAAAAAPRG